MWITGEMSVAEALSEIVQCAVDNIMSKAINGEVYIEIDNDGSYTVEEPRGKNRHGKASHYNKGKEFYCER